MKGAILRLGLYDYGFFRSWCAGGDMVMIQKSSAIVKAYNGEQSPLFVDFGRKFYSRHIRRRDQALDSSL